MHRYSDAKRKKKRVHLGCQKGTEPSVRPYTSVRAAQTGQVGPERTHGRMEWEGREDGIHQPAEKTEHEGSEVGRKKERKKKEPPSPPLSIHAIEGEEEEADMCNPPVLRARDPLGVESSWH